MNAYRLPAENKNSDVSGTFPTIKPGINNIGITGTVTSATITPRFFTI
jgi:phage-related protein